MHFFYLRNADDLTHDSLTSGNDYMDFEEQHEGVFKVLQDDYRAPHLVVERHDSDFYLENGELKAKNDIKAGDVASIDLDIFNQWLDMSKIQ